MTKEGGIRMSEASRTVLLVDGSRTMLYYYGVMLQRLSYNVRTALTGEEALKEMEQCLPSLVITEISLPRMSGLDLLGKIAASDVMRKAPMIVLSSERDPRIRESCLRLGCAGYLNKPVDADVLYRTIQTASEQSPREHIRLRVSLKVIVGDGSGLGGNERVEYATALSAGGLFIRTLYPQPKNTITPLRIFIEDREIRGKAVVLYTSGMEKGAFREPGMGMKFIEISDQDRSFVREFINAQLTLGVGSLSRDKTE